MDTSIHPYIPLSINPSTDLSTCICIHVPASPRFIPFVYLLALPFSFLLFSHTVSLPPSLLAQSQAHRISPRVCSPPLWELVSRNTSWQPHCVLTPSFFLRALLLHTCCLVFSIAFLFFLFSSRVLSSSFTLFPHCRSKVSVFCLQPISAHMLFFSVLVVPFDLSFSTHPLLPRPSLSRHSPSLLS